jgi:hypothetical protein
MPVNRRRSSRGPAVVVLAAVAVVLFSLGVRWLGAREDLPLEQGTIQLEVLNGTSEPRVGMAVATELRRRGIDVISVDNADRGDFRESILVDRRGDPRLMKTLARMLRCRLVVEQTRDHPYVDATYVIGADRAKGRSRARS